MGDAPRDLLEAPQRPGDLRGDERAGEQPEREHDQRDQPEPELDPLDRARAAPRRSG